jgi:hypothetical protein
LLFFTTVIKFAEPTAFAVHAALTAPANTNLVETGRGNTRGLRHLDLPQAVVILEAGLPQFHVEEDRQAFWTGAESQGTKYATPLTCLKLIIYI